MSPRPALYAPPPETREGLDLAGGDVLLALDSFPQAGSGPALLYGDDGPPVRITAEFPGPRHRYSAWARAADGYLRPVPALDGAVLVLDVHEGGILASAGGHSAYSWIDLTAARLAPGSAMKALVYAMALGEGLSPHSAVLDRKVEFGRGWTPDNHDGGQAGWMPLHEAFAGSSNLVTARLGRYLDPVRLAGLAETSMLHPEGGFTVNPSAVIGTSPVRLTDLAGFHAAFVNGGAGVAPHALEGRGGRRMRWLGRVQAEDMRRMLRGVTVSGTAAGAFSGARIPAAGKSGTAATGAWFTALVPDVAVAVLLRTRGDAGLSLSGGRDAGAVARQLLEEALDAGLLDRAGYRPAGAAPPVTLSSAAPASWPPAVFGSVPDSVGQKGHTVAVAPW